MNSRSTIHIGYHDSSSTSKHRLRPFQLELIQMVRCITAVLLHDKKNVVAAPGDVYQPSANWFLLITAHHVSDMVCPQVLGNCCKKLPELW